MKPAFLVTIDTEGDNLWARSSVITTNNSRYLGRFQAICERFGVRPTWLTNWEMANCPAYCDFARDVLSRGTGEVGMHLHAWFSPPEVPLTENDHLHHPYLIEFPEKVIREKVKVMTQTLEQTFGVKMLSHRAGRFSFNEVYARALIDNGYRVDGSVTPNISWKGYKGDPKGDGGTDFSKFPEHSYMLDLSDIGQAGDSPLLEIPVTVTRPWFSTAEQQIRAALRSNFIGRKIANRVYPNLAWLYPKRKNHAMLPRLMQTVLQEKRDFAEFMIHSSELMPGGSPNFPTKRSIEKLYDTLESLFEMVSRDFEPMTMQEYYVRFRKRRTSPRAAKVA